MCKLFAHPGCCILTTYLLARRGTPNIHFWMGVQKCYRLTTDLLIRFLTNYKLKSAPIIFFNMVFLTNSSDELMLFLIMMYHFFIIEEDKVQSYRNICIILYIV